MKVQYFEEQSLGVLLEKLRAQDWLELFTNTQLGCSVPDLAEFYANCSITQSVVKSEVNGKKMRFEARKLGEILGILATGFDIYVREDKTILGKARLLELSQKLSQQIGLKTPQLVKKGDVTSLHQLLFWFIIKNVIPPGQDATLRCYGSMFHRSDGPGGANQPSCHHDSTHSKDCKHRQRT